MLKDCRLAVRAQLISFIISIQFLLVIYDAPLYIAVLLFAIGGGQVMTLT